MKVFTSKEDEKVKKGIVDSESAILKVKVPIQKDAKMKQNIMSFFSEKDLKSRKRK